MNKVWLSCVDHDPWHNGSPDVRGLRCSIASTTNTASRDAVAMAAAATIPGPSSQQKGGDTGCSTTERRVIVIGRGASHSYSMPRQLALTSEVRA